MGLQQPRGGLGEVHHPQGNLIPAFTRTAVLKKGPPFLFLNPQQPTSGSNIPPPAFACNHGWQGALSPARRERLEAFSCNHRPERESVIRSNIANPPVFILPETLRKIVWQ
jgi:hypothetical protein